MNSMKRVGIITLVVALALAVVATVSNFTTEATSANQVSTTEQEYIDALKSKDAAVRAEAAKALTGATSDAAVTALLANLADSDPTAGYYTAMALAASPNVKVIPSLVAELQNKDTIVRQRAALALSNSKGTMPIGELALALNDGATAAPIAELLVNMNDETAHEVVLIALADQELSTRRHAVMAAILDAEPVVQNFILGRALASDDLTLRANAMELRDFING